MEIPSMAILRVDHIAVVVPEIDTALAFWQKALGLPLEHVEEIAVQETVVAMMPVGETEVELVQPTTETSGIAKYMAKRGPGLHHICFEVDDIEATLAQLKEQNIQLINEEPVVGAGGKRVAFVHPKSSSGVLIELSESQTVL
jgi:methylmalonyl-CoA/ethylmalonyl-CoA epimerase